MTITVESLMATATISDQVPEGWTVDERYGDAERVPDDRVYLGEVDPVGEAESVTLAYFVRAPEGPDGTGSYEFGPVLAEAVADDSSATFGGSDNFVVGVDV